MPSPVTVPKLLPVQLSGVVTDDDGAPASGVTVFAYAYDGPIGCLLRDPSTNACRSGATFAANLQIYRIRYVPVGQSITIDVKRGDSQCAIPNDDVPPLCRAVRFTGPPGAAVAVQASTNPSTGPAQLTLDRSSQTCCSLAATANVPANGELRVYLELMPLYGSGTYSFTLTSAILP